VPRVTAASESFVAYLSRGRRRKASPPRRARRLRPSAKLVRGADLLSEVSTMRNQQDGDIYGMAVCRWCGRCSRPSWWTSSCSSSRSRFGGGKTLFPADNKPRKFELMSARRQALAFSFATIGLWSEGSTSVHADHLSRVGLGCVDQQRDVRRPSGSATRGRWTRRAAGCR
jgi:hypothetical protein